MTFIDAPERARDDQCRGIGLRTGFIRLHRVIATIVQLLRNSVGQNEGGGAADGGGALGRGHAGMASLQ